MQEDVHIGKHCHRTHMRAVLFRMQPSAIWTNTPDTLRKGKHRADEAKVLMWMVWQSTYIVYGCCGGGRVAPIIWAERSTTSHITDDHMWRMVREVKELHHYSAVSGACRLLVKCMFICDSMIFEQYIWVRVWNVVGCGIYVKYWWNVNTLNICNETKNCFSWIDFFDIIDNVQILINNKLNAFN